jgi:putative ABC transport system permease protein
MFANHLAAALRSLLRSGIYSSISIIGLAIGLTAAILSWLIIRNQISYDRLISGYESTYRLVSILAPQGRPPDYAVLTNNTVAGLLSVKFREVDATTRLADDEVSLKHGGTETTEKIYWADPNFFKLMPLPAVAGALDTALRRPDGIVLTRSIAQKYFGTEEPIGQTIELGGQHPMTVAAVIEDLPINGTQLESGIFASGMASFSQLAKLDKDSANTSGGERFEINVHTFVKLKPHAEVSRIQVAMPALMEAIWPRRPPGVNASMELVRIDKVHLFPGLNPGIEERLVMTGLVGLLIFFIASVNFVNLSTARASRRALEVGIRKACGASHGVLVLLFIGESLLYVLVACVLAVAFVEWLLPHVNAFLNTGAVFDYWRHPALIAWTGLGAFVLGVLGGTYPAFVLSSFRPGEVLSGSVTRSPRAATLRYILVTAQFAILIALIIASAVIYRQRQYAVGAGLRVATDGVLLVQSKCRPALKAELQRLAGVSAVSCTGRPFLSGQAFGNVRLKDGGALAVTVAPVDSDLLKVYGLKPVAGRFFFPEADVDQTANTTESKATTEFVINEIAVHALGFASRDAAIGQPLMLKVGPFSGGAIVGVIPDFELTSVEEKIKPSAYYVLPRSFNLINVKLNGRNTADTLADVDKVWASTGTGDVVHRFFLKDYIENLYSSELRDAQLFAIFAGIAVLVACLGLVGLSAASTDRRIKEIGIRKAMGADTRQIVWLLLWQFIKPVLWASLIAWAVAALLMRHWLQGFAYHIDLGIWLFVASSSVALLVALLTVSAHCYIVARAKPITALRYE